MSRLIIHPYEFALPDLFAEGERIDSRAAPFLNAARAQGLRTLFAPSVGSACAKAEDSLLSQQTLEALQAKLDELSVRYFLPKIPKPRATWTLQNEIRRAAKGFAQAESQLA